MSSTIRNSQPYFINLDHDQLLVLKDSRGSRVEVLFGGVWLTEENDPHDRFIEAGHSLQIDKPGRVVAEAIGRTGVQVTQPSSRFGARWHALIAALKARRSAWVAHGVAGVLAVVISVGLAESTTRGFLGQPGPMHAVIALPGGNLSSPV